MKIHVVGLILLPALIAPNLNAQQPTETGSLNALATLSNLRSLIEWESAQSASEIEATDPGTVNRANQQPFFKSLLVPGWGQLSKGQRGKAYAFFAAEAILLTAIVSLKIYQGSVEDDYKTFARQHAGVQGSRSHQYYVDIGNWMTTDEYNQQRLRDRAFDRLYTASEDQWQWDSDLNRSNFKSMRLSADHAEQRSMLVLGGIILNHLLSAVDASSKSKNNPKLGVKPISSDGIVMSLRLF